VHVIIHCLHILVVEGLAQTNEDVTLLRGYVDSVWVLLGVSA
jgi:hypothetical protein